jgi:hypothetical protein
MNEKLEGQAELDLAASHLSGRAKMLGIPSAAVRVASWHDLGPSVMAHVPPWLPQLLAQHLLEGLVLEYQGPDRLLNFFKFYTPDDFVRAYHDEGVLSVLPQFGFFPFAEEADGNVWLLSSLDDPSSEVFLLDLSAWNGSDAPSKRNGLIFASSRLAYLLATMGISEASYYRDENGPHSLMWYTGRKQAEVDT